MAASASAPSLLRLVVGDARRSTAFVRCRAAASPPSHPPAPPPLRGRRHSLLLLLASPIPTLAASVSSPSAARAEDIPLFGIRRKIEKIEKAAEEIEKEAEVIVREGEKAVEEGFVAAEKEIQSAEQEIASEAVGFAVAGDLVQAAAVTGAEAVGVLVGVSVVNGILAPDRQKSQ